MNRGAQSLADIVVNVALGAVDTSASRLLLPAIWRARRSEWRATITTVVLLTPALLLGAALALGVAKFGTIVRQRMHPLVLLSPVVAAGWSKATTTVARARCPRW